jgi:hypothetical protein
MKTMKTLTLVLWLLLYCGEVFAQQPSVNWLNRIKSGQPFDGFASSLICHREARGISCFVVIAGNHEG